MAITLSPVSRFSAYKSTTDNNLATANNALQRDAVSNTDSVSSSPTGYSNLASGLYNTARTSGSTFADALREASSLAQINSATSQDFAERQMDFQRESNQEAMAWSASQAQQTRDWQEKMSNTSYQRAVDDLIKAGLNPVLAYMNSGASTPSGSTGQAYSSSGASGTVDNSINNVLSSLVSTSINSATNKEIANIYANSNEKVAEINQTGNWNYQMMQMLKGLLGLDSHSDAGEVGSKAREFINNNKDDWSSNLDKVIDKWNEFFKSPDKVTKGAQHDF